MIWRITVTHFTPLKQPQQTEQQVTIEAPTAADAITICNTNNRLPAEGAMGTPTALDRSKITRIEWVQP